MGWGYESTDTPVELEAAYAELTGVIAGLIPQGLAGAMYTLTTDVESELNGLLTYDRALFKIPPKRLAELHRPLLD